MADTPRQTTPVAPTADAIVGELKARAARQAAYQRLRAARLRLYRESLEAPLGRPQADWYAAWRAVRAASAAGDLGAGVDGLVRAAAAWREVGRVCERWRAEGEAWSARVTAEGDAPVSYYPEGVPDGPLARWAVLILARPGLPTLAAPLARPECELGLAVLRIVADAGVTAGHFQDFFAHEPFDVLQDQALGLAVAMVPPPAGLVLDPEECPRPPAAVARSLVCLVAGCHDGAREYLAAAMGFLEAPAATCGTTAPPAKNPYLPDAAAAEQLAAEVEALAARYFAALEPLTAAFRVAAPACRAGGGPRTVAALAGLAAAVRAAGLADWVSSLREAPRWGQFPQAQAAAGFALCQALSCEARDFPAEAGRVTGGDAYADILCDIGGTLLDTLRRRTYGPFAARLSEIVASCGGPTLTALRERLGEAARLAYRDWTDPFKFHDIELEARPEPAGPGGERAADGVTQLEPAPEAATLLQLEQAVRAVECGLRECGPFSRNADGSPGDVYAEQSARNAFDARLAEDQRLLQAMAGYEKMRTLVARDFDDELTTSACSRVRRALVRTGMTAAVADGLHLEEVVRRLQGDLPGDRDRPGEGHPAAGDASDAPRLTTTQREAVVSAWLARTVGRGTQAQKDSRADTLTIREVGLGTKIPTTSVQKTSAWRAFEAERKSRAARAAGGEARSVRTRQLSDRTIAVRADPDAEDPAEAAATRDALEAAYLDTCTPAERGEYHRHTAEGRAALLSLYADQREDERAERRRRGTGPRS